MTGLPIAAGSLLYSAPGRRHAVQISDVLRHHPVAARSDRRRLAAGRPRPAARCRRRSGGRDPHRTALPSGRAIFPARPENAALLPAGRRHRGPRADRAAVQQLRADRGPRPGGAGEKSGGAAAHGRCARWASSRTKHWSRFRGAASGATACCRNISPFPEKFCFVDISGFEQLAAADFGEQVELLIYLSDFERSDRRQTLEFGVSQKTFRLGCAPVVNLFEQTAEPILMEQKRFEYRIVPDARREESLDIFSINEVTGVMSGSAETVAYEPFFSTAIPAAPGPPRRSGTARAASPAGAPIRPRTSTSRSSTFPAPTKTPDRDSVTVRLTCSNGELPSRLPFGNEEGDFQLASGGPITRIVALTKPTDALQPPTGQGPAVAPGFAALAQLSFAGERGGRGLPGDPAAAQFHRLAGRRQADRCHSRGCAASPILRG